MYQNLFKFKRNFSHISFLDPAISILDFISNSTLNYLLIIYIYTISNYIDALVTITSRHIGKEGVPSNIHYIYKNRLNRRWNKGKVSHLD